MTRLLRPLLAAGAFTLVAMPTAQAHLDIEYPAMRGGDQKTGPCEGVLLITGDSATTRLSMWTHKKSRLLGLLS